MTLGQALTSYRLFVQISKHGIDRIITSGFSLSGNNIPCLLYCPLCYGVIPRLPNVEWKATLHKGFVQKYVDSIGKGKAEFPKMDSASLLTSGSTRMLIAAVLAIVHSSEMYFILMQL